MGTLIPNEPLIYERANGVVYARYRDRPDIPRWIIGSDKQKGTYLSYNDWQQLTKLAENNITIKTQLDKLINLYYLIKEKK